MLQEKGCPRCVTLNASLKFQDAPVHDEGPIVESGSREIQIENKGADQSILYCHLESQGNRDGPGSIVSVYETENCEEVDRLNTIVEQLKAQWQESEQRLEEASADDRSARNEFDAALATLKAQANEGHAELRDISAKFGAELRSLGDEAARAEGERQELRTLLTSLQEGQVEVIRHLQGALDVQENHRTQLAQQQRALEAASQDRAALRTMVERVDASTSLVTGKLAYLIHTS